MGAADQLMAKSPREMKKIVLEVLPTDTSVLSFCDIS